MKKKISTFLAVTMSALTILSCSNVCAEERVIDKYDVMSITTDKGLTFTAEPTEEFISATIINETLSNPEPNVYELNRTYQLEDGTIVNDILTVEESMMRSKEGKNTVTRKTDASNFSTVYICATFDWYEQGLWSYVQCSSMAAYHVDKSSSVGTSYFNSSKSEGYKQNGKAHAQVNYRFYNKDLPIQSCEGTFKVTCSDNGVISDNG